MPRITLDTNVMVSALIGDRRGASAAIWRRILRKQDALACSEQIISEVEEVLGALGVENTVRAAFVSRLRKIAIMVKPKHERNYVQKDPSDDKIIETAIAGKTAIIVSGDKKHLLPLGKVEGVRIMSPADYLKEIGK